MLFYATITVNLPFDMVAEQSNEIKQIEKEYAQKFQAEGKWRHLWRVVGEYANVSIFDVSSNEELCNILSNLLLFSYMKIQVALLCRHFSSIKGDD